MNTQQMLQEIQDKIGDKTPKIYCEVKAMEWDGEGVERDETFFLQEDHRFYFMTYDHGYEDYREIFPKDSKHLINHMGYKEGLEIISIVKNPNGVSLARILSALGHPYYYFDDEIKKYYDSGLQDRIICERKLLNDDNSDCVLSDQSPETIKAIWEIVCKCNHISDGLAYMSDPVQYKCKKCGEMFK